MEPITKEIEAIIEDANNGFDAAYVRIPFDVKAIFGSGRPKIVAVFDGIATYRGLIVKYGTPFYMLLLTQAVRTKIKKGVGDKVQVKISLDTTPREVAIPKELQNHLDKDKKMAQFFNNLSYTNQKEYALHISSAKRDETRAKRLEKVLSNLKAQKKKLNE